MEITKELKENWKADKANLQKAITSIKKSVADYKTKRKSDWKSFKDKFKVDLREVEHLLEKVKTLRKN
jgi:hypothetical protein